MWCGKELSNRIYTKKDFSSLEMWSNTFMFLQFHFLQTILFTLLIIVPCPAWLGVWCLVGKETWFSWEWTILTKSIGLCQDVTASLIFAPPLTHSLSSVCWEVCCRTVTCDLFCILVDHWTMISCDNSFCLLKWLKWKSIHLRLAQMMNLKEADELVRKYLNSWQYS